MVDFPQSLPAVQDLLAENARLRAELARLQGGAPRLAYVPDTHDGEAETRRHSQRLEGLGREASKFAHRINNLLTPIVGTATLMRDGVNGDAATRALVEVIEDAAARCKSAAEQFLGYARKDGWQPRPVDAVDFVDGLKPMLDWLVPAGVRLALDVPPRGAVVRADPGQLEQVLVNLVVNGCDAMEEGGALNVSIGVRDEQVVLTVADTGPGMTPDVVERALQPFFTTKAVGRGTGLGLAICQEIVERHGGSLRIRTAPGAGTAVDVHLPRAPAVAPSR